MKYSNAYEWWQGEHKEVLSWTISDDGEITIGKIFEAMLRHPGCKLAIVEPEFNLCREVIGKYRHNNGHKTVKTLM